MGGGGGGMFMYMRRDHSVPLGSHTDMQRNIYRQQLNKSTPFSNNIGIQYTGNVEVM